MKLVVKASLDLLHTCAQIAMLVELHLQVGDPIVLKDALQRHNERVIFQLVKALSLTDRLVVSLDALQGPEAPAAVLCLRNCCCRVGQHPAHAMSSYTYDSDIYASSCSCY